MFWLSQTRWCATVFFPTSAINYNMCRLSSVVIYDDRKIKSVSRFCISSRHDAPAARSNDRRAGKYWGFSRFSHYMYIRDGHASFPARFPRGITYREKLRASWFKSARGKFRQNIDTDRIRKFAENWRGNKEIPENTSVFIEGACAGTDPRICIFRVLSLKDCPALLRGNTFCAKVQK